ncbi:ABC transporter substrate-binding protein [Rhodococcus sp. O3]|uniref:ABC transporter substrate-binding protein n=1 Tax=Rhodococcus sp. O3 TaxID=3404919 RepID=UPI003B6751E0
MKRRLSVAVLAIAGLFGTTACGSGGGPVANGEMPAEIKIVSVTDKTGLTAFGGQPQFRGIELAVEQINEQNYLGGSRFALRSRDAASDTQTAVSQAVEATADRSVSAMIGGISSAQATAISPLAERSGLPTIYTQSASNGVLIGDYTFRATPPQTTHVATSMAHLRQLGVKRLSVLYNAGNPALAEMAEKNLVEGQEKYGFEIVSATSVQNSTQDFATSASKIAAEQPDAVAFLLVGAQNATAMRQLRQAGYAGPVLGQTGAGTNNLVPAGADGAGMFWTTNFTVDQPFPSSQAFVAAYRAKYGEDPVNYAAEGYDAAWMLAHAVKAAGGASREDIQRGLEIVLENGFEGAQGLIGFEGHDMRTPGVLVEWNGTREIVLMEPAKI